MKLRRARWYRLSRDAVAAVEEVERSLDGLR